MCECYNNEDSDDDDDVRHNINIIVKYVRRTLNLSSRRRCVHGA